MTPNVLTCTGRAVTNDGQPTGPECGRTLARDGWDCWVEADHDYLARARAAGWLIGTARDGTTIAGCPSCSRPDPVTVQWCRELERGRG